MAITPPIRRQLSPCLAHSNARYACELFIGVILVCIALHTFFLAGLIVPVTVSGGSMAETILGPRREVRCPTCGIKFACGHERFPANDRAVCLNCGARNVDLNAGWDWPGEHALVDRASLGFRPPRRWEVLVFQCPEQANTYCIKRVVGLPGEAIQIRAGDVYVNGVIARKNLAECRALAQLVHDASFIAPTANATPLTPRWQPAEENNGWSEPTAAAGVYHFDPVQQAREPVDEPVPAWLEFHAARQRPITDDDSYNQSESRRLNPVSDVMLRCDLLLSGAGMLTIRSEVVDDRFELHLHPAQQTCTLWRAGQELTTARIAGDAFARSAQLEVIRFDRQIFVAIGGRLVMSHAFEARPAPAATVETPDQPLETPPAWAIGPTDLHVEVRHLQVLRDIYYTLPAPGHNAWGTRNPVRLSADAFFVLGDNSPISADSRTLGEPGIERKLLVGRLLTTW